jgi:hypothetical protein
LNNPPAVPIDEPVPQTCPTGQIGTPPSCVTPTNVAALTGKPPAKASTSAAPAPVQVTSADAAVAVVVPKANVAIVKVAKKTPSYKRAYIIGSLFVLGIIVVTLITKFIALPGLSFIAKRSAINKTVVPIVAANPIDPLEASNNLSNIPDPQIPAPSTIVQPNKRTVQDQ